MFKRKTKVKSNRRIIMDLFRRDSGRTRRWEVVNFTGVRHTKGQVAADIPESFQSFLAPCLLAPAPAYPAQREFS